ncbi:MAG TPA: hypothetical protein VK898_18780 [Chloroflexota bacterium]|nr:hypothetical protein [Chloroflexota bacterium]
MLVAGSVMLLYALRQQAQNVLTIANQSGQTIPEMKVVAGEQSATYRKIDSGKDVTVPFVTRGDEHIKVSIALADRRSSFNGPAGERLQLIIDRSGNISQPTDNRR